MENKDTITQLTLSEDAANGSTGEASFSLPQATVMQPAAPVLDIQDFDSAEAARTWIFSTNDLLEEVVYVPEWKMEVLLVGLTASQRNAIIKTAADNNGQPDIDKLYADMVIKSARHPKTRELLFHPADRKALNERSGKVLDQLSTVVSRLSGLTEKAEQDATKN